MCCFISRCVWRFKNSLQQISIKYISYYVYDIQGLGLELVKQEKESCVNPVREVLTDQTCCSWKEVLDLKNRCWNLEDFSPPDHHVVNTCERRIPSRLSLPPVCSLRCSPGELLLIKGVHNCKLGKSRRPLIFMACLRKCLSSLLNSLTRRMTPAWLCV